MAMSKILLKLNSVERKSESPVVILSLTAYKKISPWTKLAADVNNWEVSGLGTIIPKHGGLFVSDVWLIKPKKVGGAHVEMDPASINALMMKLFQAGRDMKNLRFLWHSHANFGVMWSGTDDETARNDFCPDAKWTVNLVTNAQGHFLARQDFPKDQLDPLHDLPVRLLIPIQGKQNKAYRQYYLDQHAEHMSRSQGNGHVADLYEMLGSEMDGTLEQAPKKQLLLPPPRR